MESECNLPPETDIRDVHAALRGLLRLFHAKLFRTPSAHAVRVYLALLQHAEQHYRRPGPLLAHPSLRLDILDLLYSVRINAGYQVGFCYDSAGNPVGDGRAPLYSPFVCVSAAHTHHPAPAQQVKVGRLNISIT